MSKKIKATHLVGIVPIAGQPLDFNLPWHDCLMPIAPDYTAAERAVYECAVAGCDSIWVVGHLGTQPLVRKRLGDFIADPVSRISSLNPSLRQRDIAIYYISIRPKDMDLRDCLSWSILYGADTAFRMSIRISNWIKPTKYYCAFPYGIMPDRIVWDNRDRIRSTEKTIFSHKNNTIKNNLHISFTFDESDYKIARDILIRKQLNDSSIKQNKSKKLYTLEEVFLNLEINKKHIINTPWFYDISNWDNYRSFLSTKECGTIEKNKECFLTAKRQKFLTANEVLEMNKIDRFLRFKEIESMEES